MCLVSYIPTKDGFVFSSNRDEVPERNAMNIRTEIIKNKTIFYPADVKGGSWIFTSDHGDIICLLNGAHVAHERRSHYRLSRGLMLKAYFSYASPVDFIQYFNFEGIEPFTCVIVSPRYFFEFIWDGQVKYVKVLDPQKSFNWSSCTLYSPEVQKERSSWFEQALTIHPTLNQLSIEIIHLTQQKDRIEDAFVMDREGIVQTISLTQIDARPELLSLSHLNLLSSEKEVLQINILR